jgi:hypothetical protein
MTPEQKLKKIAKIYDTETAIKGRPGHITSTHARHNLMGAYLDLKRTGKADKVCLNTIKRVVDQLNAIESLLPVSRP